MGQKRLVCSAPIDALIGGKLWIRVVGPGPPVPFPLCPRWPHWVPQIGPGVLRVWVPELRCAGRFGPAGVPRCALGIFRPGVPCSGSCVWRPRGAHRGRVSLPSCHVHLRGEIPTPKGYPTEPQTVGEHLLKKRMELGFLQREAAARLGVSVATLINWEKRRHEPEIRPRPAIIEFLGFDPSPKAMALEERLRQAWRQLGWSQRELAQALGVDPSTLGAWECGEHRPAERLRKDVGESLRGVEGR